MGKTRVSPPPTERRPVYVRRGNQEGRVIPGTSATYAATSTPPSQPTSTARTPSANYASAEVAKGGWIPVTPESGSSPSVATGGGVSHTAYYLNWQKVEEAENAEKTDFSSEVARKPDSVSATQPISYQSEFAYEKIVPQPAMAPTPPATSPTTFFTKTFRSSRSQALSAWDQKKAALSATFSHSSPLPQENPQLVRPATPSASSSQGWLVTTTQKTLPTPPTATQAPSHNAIGSQATIPTPVPPSAKPASSAPAELAPGILDLLSLPAKE
ncbi:MAG: hypothetical protein Q4D62_03880 [Planctomycetia bacterium]|nr:hypothetical protein [Planctomycetia bacterium]